MPKVVEFAETQKPSYLKRKTDSSKDKGNLLKIF